MQNRPCSKESGSIKKKVLGIETSWSVSRGGPRHASAVYIFSFRTVIRGCLGTNSSGLWSAAAGEGGRKKGRGYPRLHPPNRPGWQGHTGAKTTENTRYSIFAFQKPRFLAHFKVFIHTYTNLSRLTGVLVLPHKFDVHWLRMCDRLAWQANVSLLTNSRTRNLRLGNLFLSTCKFKRYAVSCLFQSRNTAPF